VIDDVDLIYFPDVGMGELPNWLRNHGYKVCGSGKAEVLEQNRKLSAEIMDKYNITYPKSQFIVGIDEAIKRISEISETSQQAKGEYYVKIDIWRGTIDSFPVQDAKSATQHLTAAKNKLGPYASNFVVTIQEKVEGIEAGFDAWFNGKEFMYPVLWGFESGASYLGVVSSDLPDYFIDVMDKITPYLREMSYRGALSVEGIYGTNDGIYYMIDWCCRMPLPLGVLYPFYIEDFGAFLMTIAEGSSTFFPMENALYGVAEINTSEIDNYTLLKGDDNAVFLRYLMDESGNKYNVPGVGLVGAVVGKSDTLDDLSDKLDASISKLDIYFGSSNNIMHDIWDNYVVPLRVEDKFIIKKKNEGYHGKAKKLLRLL